MTTYVSPQVQAGLVRGNWRGSDFTVYGQLTPGSAALNDIYQLVLVPNGYMITDIAIDTGQLDSNGTPTVVFSFGDSGSPARFITGSTIAKTGGIQYPNVAGTYGYTYAVAQGGQFAGGQAGGTILQMKITTAAATFAAGTVRAVVQMYLDPQLGGYT